MRPAQLQSLHKFSVILLHRAQQQHVDCRLMSTAMVKSVGSSYPPALSKAQYDHLLFEIQNVALLNGLAVKPPVQFMPLNFEKADVVTAAPITFFPSLFPRDCFNEARGIQCAYNELYALISQDEDWVVATVAE